MKHHEEREIEQSFEAVRDKMEEAETVFGEFRDASYGEPDEDDPTLNDVARPVIVALQSLLGLVDELRKAGATIEEVPQEEEALITCIVNAHLIGADIKADVEHLESIMERVKPSGAGS